MYPNILDMGYGANKCSNVWDQEKKARVVLAVVTKTAAFLTKNMKMLQ